MGLQDLLELWFCVLDFFPLKGNLAATFWVASVDARTACIRGVNFSSMFSTFWSRICSAASLNCTECPLTQST